MILLNPYYWKTKEELLEWLRDYFASSIIISLSKKGNLQLMTNWRGICLMTLADKLYNRMVLNWICKPIDAILRKNQVRFRTGRSCIQQIHILRRIMNGAFSQNIPIFVDKISHSSTSRSHSTQLIDQWCLPFHDLMASLTKLSRKFVFYTTSQHARCTFEDKYLSLSLSLQEF